MSSIAPIEFEKIDEQLIKKLFVRYSDEAVNLRVTEKMLAEIENRLLADSKPCFDIRYVKENLQKFKSLTSKFNYDDYLQTDFLLRQEMNLWRGFLEERDHKIETYHLRRFFDTSGVNLDNAVFIALAFFYRSSAFYEANLSKFDLAVTRLFTKSENQTHREINLGRQQRITHLMELFNNWDGIDQGSNLLSQQAVAAISQFDEFIFETESLIDFEDLIQSRLFERLRAFKKDLGKNFFDPAVTAVAVECNLIVGNAFNALLTKANRSLSVRLTAENDFAGAYCDTSPSSQIHISEVLSQLRENKDNNLRISTNSDMLRVWENLNVICHENQSQQSSPKSFQLLSSAIDSAQDRLQLYQQTIYEKSPDLLILRNYIAKSKALWTLELNAFITNQESLNEQICRETLFVIFWTDELCNHELKSIAKLSRTTIRELKELSEKSQKLADQLQQLIFTEPYEVQNRLLMVSNKLLEMRLRFEKTIGKFGDLNLDDLGAPPHVSDDLEIPSDLPKTNSTSPNRITNGWLIISVIGAFFLFGSFVFFMKFLN